MALLYVTGDVMFSMMYSPYFPLGYYLYFDFTPGKIVLIIIIRLIISFGLLFPLLFFLIGCWCHQVFHFFHLISLGYFHYFIRRQFVISILFHWSVMFLLADYCLFGFVSENELLIECRHVLFSPRCTIVIQIIFTARIYWCQSAILPKSE